MSRRRTATSRAILAVVLVACVALGVFSALNGWPQTFWGWVLRAGLPLGMLLLAARNHLEQRGKLTRLRNRGLGGLAAVLGLAALSLVIVVANGSTPQLGLDLQGGYSIVLTAEGEPPSDTIDQAIEIIRQRIDGLGVAEPEITRQGSSVVVDLPGISDREQAQELVGTTALMQFRPVLNQMAGVYSPEAEAAGQDPCAPLPDVGGTEVPVEVEETPPAEDPPAEEPPAPTDPAPEETPTPAGDQPQGAARPGAVVDGANAAGPIPGRQAPEDDTTTTGSEVPPPEGDTVPAEGTVPAEDVVPTEDVVPAEDVVPTAEPAATDTVILPREEGGTCVELGPVGFEGDALSDSTAMLGPAGQNWVVNVSIKGDHRAAANVLFNSCYNGEPTCPPIGVEGRGLTAIVLDHRVVSDPQVNGLNLADSSEGFTISGGGTSGFSEGEAKDLALKLRYGALPVEFTSGAERQISPTVGEDSLRAGVMAGLIGLAVVLIYLAIYYRALALIVIMGMGVWSVLMYGLVCWLSATQGLTLSLSGVVGIVISIGTTVDSYVVHFERLKDEVRLGKSVRSSAERGFRLAFRTILTANVAALIGAGLLWWLTVGAVRGFAFFLGLSVLLDLFVIWTFERPMVALFARSRFFTEHRIFGVARGLGRREATAGAGATVGATS